jgi:nucleoid-associated protein YgaU
VVAGDSLSKIAKKLLGSANRWREIHELNKDAIKNPDLIRPGQVLKIPDA